MKLIDGFEKCPGIYIFTNLINGKSYVGETMNMRYRMGKHRYDKKQVIDKAIRKYGVENFEVYVEYFPAFSKLDLISLEEELIIRFKSLTPNGYNILAKGQDSTGFKHSDETKAIMSKMKKGIAPSPKCILKAKESNSGRIRPKGIKKSKRGPMPEDRRLKISNSNKGKPSPFKEKKHSDESKRKMSESKKGKETHNNSMAGLKRSSESKKIPIIQIDPLTSRVLKIWPSIVDAAEHIKSRERVTSIVACLKGKHKTALGFKWEYYKPIC